MSAEPIENLEQRASQQRNRIHQTASELRSKVAVARENLSPENYLRHHFAAASLAASGVAFGIGYLFAGLFKR